MLLFILGGVVSLNAGPLMLVVLNARWVNNKGPLHANIVASHDLNLLSLTETYVRLFDTRSFQSPFYQWCWFFH